MHTRAFMSAVSKTLMGFPGFPMGSAGKESACSAGDPDSILRLGRFPWRRDRLPTPVFMGFPGGSDGKDSASSAGDLGSIPGLGRSPGEGKGSHSSILAWRVPWTVHGVAKSWTRLTD